jgi:hypothetical protein
VQAFSPGVSAASGPPTPSAKGLTLKVDIPYYCPACKAEGLYYGRLVRPNEQHPVHCPNPHKVPVVLVPVPR